MNNIKPENQSVTVDSPQYEKKSKKKFAIYTIIFSVIGMILGFITALGSDVLKEYFSKTSSAILPKLPTLQIFVSPVIMLFFIIICIIIVATLMKKGKTQINTWDGEDDDHIKIADSYLSKGILVSNIQLIVIQILFGIVSYNLLKNLHSKKDAIMIFIAIGIYFLGLFSTIIQQNRLVSLVKQYSPEKQGSIYDMKFQKVWLSTCDEGELHMIHEASYRTHRLMANVFSVSLTIAIIVGMFFPIGILCAVIIGLFWLIQTCYYSIECIKLENRQ